MEPSKHGEPYNRITGENMAKEYFPMTLGAAYTMLKPPHLNKSTLNNMPNGIIRPNPAPWKPKKSSNSSRPSRSKRPHSASSNSNSSSTSSVDRMYLLTAEAPSVGSSTVLLSSPFQSELARLRMERLRIEEQHLLEVVRQDELEKIRGPKPKWYELKGPEFHYEAHKNTELIHNKRNWQSMLDYRNQLVRDSKEYQETYGETSATMETYHRGGAHSKTF